MKNEKIKKIVLVAILLLVIAVIPVFFVIILQLYDGNSSMVNIQFTGDVSIKSEDEKYTRYLDGLESSFEAAILEGFKLSKGIDVEITEENQIRDVTVVFNKELEISFDENEIDGIYEFIANGNDKSIKVNVKIIDQNGKIIRESNHVD